MKKFHLKLSDNNNVIQEIEIIAETSSIAKTKAMETFNITDVKKILFCKLIN